MTPMFPLPRLGLLLCVLLVLSAPMAPRAETPAGRVVESRLIVGMSVPPEAIAAMMPEGWTGIAFPAGPLKGANAMLNFLDGHAVVSTEGKTTGTRLTAALIAPGRQPDGKEVRLFVLRVYTDDPEANPYGNTRSASLFRSRTATASADGQALSETWTVAAEDGQIAFALDYNMGVPGWSSGESSAFSAVDPDLAVRQTYQQIADLAMSEAMGKPLSGEVTLESSLPELAVLFDGSERIVSIVTVPVYIREVFLP